MEKQCSKCREMKPIGDFYSRGDRSQKPRAACRACTNDRVRLWQMRNREKRAAFVKDWSAGNADRLRQQRRAWQIKNRDKIARQNRERDLRAFGITLDDYAALLERQGGACAICFGPPAKKRRHYSVDHCHATNRVRGLLCHNCNVAIGLMKDRPDLVLRMAEYLERSAS